MPRVCARVRRLLPRLIASVIVVAGAAAQTPREQIDAALDRQIDQLNIGPAAISDALDELGRHIGLRFALDPDVAGLMPSGAATRIRIDIRNMTVRAALQNVFDELGLQMEPIGDKVVVRPGPLLERVARPFTPEENTLIGNLATRPWSELAKASPAPELEFHFPPELKAREKFEQALGQLARRPAARQFDAVCETLGWSWRPEDAHIVFEPRQEEIRRRLERRIDLSYQRMALDQLLLDLGRRVGVTVAFDGAVLQKVAARERAVDLIQRRVSVRQTFERICGNTGLRFDITDDGVRFAAPDAPPPAEASNGGDVVRAAPVIPAGASNADLTQWVWIEMELQPGVKFLVPVKADQLPPRVRQECERKLREMISGMK